MMVINIINIAILCLLIITAVMIEREPRLLASTILTGIYSLLIASLFICLDAVDVALTEAVVGAGVATVFFLCVLGYTRVTQERQNSSASWLGLVLTGVMGGLLFYGIADIPYFGDPNNPVHTYLADRYIHQSFTEVGVPNLVTAILASYRGYDTLGEVVVIITASIGILTLLNGASDKTHDPATPLKRDGAFMNKHLILHFVCYLLIPFILLFALYVQFHGDYGPGGGFQAGVLFAVGLILYGLVRDVSRLKQLIPVRLVKNSAIGGVLLYITTGVIASLKGGQFLEYNVLMANPISGQHLGILMIELGVGLAVASAMLLFFYALSSPSPQ